MVQKDVAVHIYCFAVASCGFAKLGLATSSASRHVCMRCRGNASTELVNDQVIFVINYIQPSSEKVLSLFVSFHFLVHDINNRTIRACRGIHSLVACAKY